MAANTAISVTDLDFNEIKSSLKSYLASQSAFAGYDFSGSGLDVLLDILAYNTHYNAYYLNMVANESFLDTALLRDSVVSHAKKFHYIPRSATAPRAKVNLVVTPKISYTSENLTIDSLNFLSEQVDGTTYNFVTVDTLSTTKSNGVFTFSNVDIYELEPAGYSFTVDLTSNPKQMFTIPDVKIDTSKLLVTVQESISNTSSKLYSAVDDVLTITANSEVYFLQEGQDALYQVYFGDDVIGKSLKNGNIVILNYGLTNGSASNYANNFTLITSISAADSVSVTPILAAAGGSIRESVDEIKFAAPLQFLAQNRAVTKNDYIKLIQQKYPFFDAVNVWGGEENDPPVYGKVFICAKPKGGFEVTDTEKDYIKNNILKDINILTVTPEIVDIDYNYINILAEVYYDPTKTTQNVETLRANLKTLITNYCSTNLNQFNSYFKYSGLETAIDAYNSAIVSNEVNLVLEKRFRPNLIQTESYILSFGLPLSKGSSGRSLGVSAGTPVNFFSEPSFSMLDENGVVRNCFIEEIPSSYTGVESISVTNPGLNYTSTPTVEIIGDGTGATATAVIVNSKLSRIDVITPGIGYTSAAVRIVGGDGLLGAATPILEGRYGSLRIFYYKPDAVTNTSTKSIINSNNNSGIMGRIDYATGTIYIDNFNPMSINNDFGDLKIHARPTINIVRSYKNKMLVLDSEDSSSIVVDMIPTVTNG